MAEGRLGESAAALIEGLIIPNAWILSVLVIAASWLLLRPSQGSKPSNLLPSWVPLEVGISTALLQANGIASYLPYVDSLYYYP